mgnify:CR=1 FL=1
MSFLRLYAESNLLQIASYAIQLISSIILARSLGPEGKGAYSAALAIQEIVFYLFLFGVGNGILYAAAKKQEKAPEIAFQAILISLFNGTLSALVLVLLGVFKNPLVRNLEPVFLFLVAPAALTAVFLSNMNYLLMARGGIREAYFINFLSSTIQCLLFVAAWISGKLNVFSALFLFAASNFLIAAIQFYVIAKIIGFKPIFSLELIKDILFISRKAYFISLMGYIIVRSDLVILNSIRGNYEVGIYSVAAALASKMLILTSPISHILAPRTIKEPEAQVEFLLKVSRTLVFFLSLLLFVADVLYYPAVYVLYGKEFVKSIVPFLILNPGILFLSLANTIYPYFLSRGLPAITLIAPFSAATANIFLNIILIPYFGYNAAAFTSSLSYLIYYVIFLGYFLKMEKKKLKEALIPRSEEIVTIFRRIYKNLPEVKL